MTLAAAAISAATALAARLYKLNRVVKDVTCGKRLRRVTYLELWSRGLEGSLSPNVGTLTFLRGLDMYNNFQGAIPHELGRLSRLRFLYLSDNKLNRVIPANISSCSNLKTLELSHNELVGSIPKEIGFLSKLLIVNLRLNKLTGGIPPFLGNITSIEVFDATLNPLGGSIQPDILCHWKKPKIFSTSGCNLSRAITQELGCLSKLRILDLGYNKLKGFIPSNISNCANLKVLDLSINELVGSIPKEIRFFPKLIYLKLSDNKLTGGIPPFLGNITLMEVLDVSGILWVGAFQTP
ncbi:probable leucine-rich repeat receptor-like protein kinase At1g35710 [Helianthus annuus]|nr:probable leucine-rich repeat receptor-like protein kinase At1g35710 [Helianthus annuus]